jgi:hypothetical protein
LCDVSIRALLNLLHAHCRHGNQRVHWVNVREEPVLYVNGRAFVLRDVAQPTTELTNLHGIDSGMLEAVERRLKRDVERESGSSGCSNVLVHDEAENGAVHACWEAVSGVSAQQWEEEEAEEDGANEGKAKEPKAEPKPSASTVQTTKDMFACTHPPSFFLSYSHAPSFLRAALRVWCVRASTSNTAVCLSPPTNRRQCTPCPLSAKF